MSRGLWARFLYIIIRRYAELKLKIPQLTILLHLKSQSFSVASASNDTVVDYTREPFVYEPGNVGVTLDYNIRTGMLCADFMSADCITIPAGELTAILEVK